MLLPLEAKDTGKNALLAMVLKKSNNLYKTEKQIDRVLASLYNASIDMGIEKIDNMYNMQFSMEILNAEYMTKEELLKARNLLVAFICDPNVNNDSFDEIIVERQKASLIEKISEERDDKKRYALKRLEEDMFCATEYGASVLGTIEDIQKITAKELYTWYKEVISKAEVVVTATGNLDKMEEFPKRIYEDICETCGKHMVKNKAIVENISKDIKENIEIQQISQSVLCIGVRLYIQKEDMYKALVYNSLLGGTPASKLFQNVREKESLAYFAKSTYNRHKQAIYMFAGVDPIKQNKAKEVMLEQLEMLKRGDVSDVEFNAAKQSIMSAYIETKDSKAQLARQMLNNEVYFNDQISIEEMVKEINEVTLEDVIDIANKVKVTNVFILGGITNA